MRGRAAVIGSGAWGTAFAKMLAEAGSDVTIWARREPVAAEIRDRHVNDGALPGVTLPKEISATSDLAAAVDGAGLIAIAVPSQTLRGNLAEWAPYFAPDSTLISLMKGIELGTTKRMSQVMVETGRVDADRVVVVSGPNLAPEIAAGQPTATVVACLDEERAKRVQHALALPYFRPYTSEDVIGCEMGGAVKNVIALAYGMTIAMGMGDNTRASLITRGLAETARLGVALGADPLTFAGLAGLGDLVATCSSPLSRNRAFGARLGQGESVQQAQEATHGQVAEGAKSCRSVLELAQRHGVDVPITQAVEAVCFRGLTPPAMLEEFMSRSVKSEV